MINKLMSLNILRGFKYKNYRYYFLGQGISLVGTWMQRTALSWYIYTLTNSVFWLGLLGFISQIPSFFITPFGGYIADKFPRIKVLRLSQSLAMCQALILAILVLSQTAQIWHIVVLSFFLGSIEAFEAPIRHSFVVNLIEDKTLVGNAIALNSAMFNGARLIGPAVAGYLVAFLGEGLCFLANGISYIAVLISLFNIRNINQELNIGKTKVLENIKEGYSYLLKHKSILYFIFNIIIFTLFGFNYVVLLPFLSREVLGGDAKTLGMLMSMIGLGALIGAIYLGSRKNSIGLSKIIVNVGHMACIAIFLIAFSKNITLSAVLALICGTGMMMQMAGANTVIQTLVDDRMRGRIMSIYSLAFLGFMPLGSLLSGYLSTLIGVTPTLSISAVICLISGFLMRKKLINII
ncbi:MAG: MFS transporter [Candidatus Cloacimonetes bacterium]|nr:MFS transporter [Candidatus Cloacimonadota bacterium]